jgi:hypothetical protein
MRLRLATVALLAIALALCALSSDRLVQFNRDVRPILSDKCFGCHGPDAAAKKIPFRLDSQDATKDHLANIIPRITAAKPALRMPPVYSGLKLAEAEIETLRLWIAQGGKWQNHWSFIPPEQPPLPAIRNAAWPRNPIDYFILDRLEREGLPPSPEASRETLFRRVSLDLTGLPPTPAELDAFLRDPAPNAYEKVVDRLLASPRYGEHMAARWLDAARYADSNGYQYDGERVMWRWRDWVIDAFNRNQPFDQFTIEQIAGDMLPNASRAQRIATGFNRNHRGNTEDGIVPEEYAVEYVVDRVETTSTVFLGLTLGCARCHNHKYDPFSQKEFYQTFAYFNNVPESGRAIKYGNSPPLEPAPTEAQQRELNNLEVRISQEQQILHDRGPGRLTCAPCTGRWLPPDESPLAPLTTAAAFDIDDRFTLSARISSESTPDGPILTRMQDTPKGRGFALLLDQGKVNFNLVSNYESDAIRVETEDALQPGRSYHLTVSYDGTIMAQGVAIYIDGKAARVHILQDNLYRPFRNAGRAFKEPFRIGAGAGKRFGGTINDVHVFSRVASADEIDGLALDESVNTIAAKSEATRTSTENNVLRWYSLENAADRKVREAWHRLNQLLREKEKLERAFPTVMVMAESNPPKETHLLIRGAYDKPGETVEPGIPAALPPLPSGAPNNRLGFAQWLVSPGNPLLARVTVNRFWQTYFGTGIVKTVEDFGSQGEPPSHPELLDWLATEFIRSGWDTKAMQKLIVMSATYRESSMSTPDRIQRDPDNRLLARGPRFRLSAETIRDQALYVAGLLTEKIGGPSVKPYQPAGLWKDLSMQDMDYIQSKGADLYRRSLYIFWKRTIAPPTMVTFDAAQRESCVVRETRTNTPLQALDLMNDVTFVEAARNLGQRMLKSNGDRLRNGFRTALARDPSAQELQILRDNLNYHLDYFATAQHRDSHAIDEFLHQGDSPIDATLDKRQLAAYASVASLILNLDEMVTKQ